MDKPTDQILQRFTWAARAAGDERSKFDIQLGAARNDEDRLAAVLQNSKIELKTESFQWEQTGNIFIEYKSRGKPSGIAATQADYWCHELVRGNGTVFYLLMQTERLKQICRRKLNTPADKQFSGDDLAQRGIVLRISDLLIEL
jgi:hypothetical protein